MPGTRWDRRGRADPGVSRAPRAAGKRMGERAGRGMLAPHLLLLDGAQEEAPLTVGERCRLHGLAVRRQRARMIGGEGGAVASSPRAARAQLGRAAFPPSGVCRQREHGRQNAGLVAKRALFGKPFPAIQAKPAPTHLHTVSSSPVPGHQSVEIGTCPSSHRSRGLRSVSPPSPPAGQTKCPQLPLRPFSILSNSLLTFPYCGAQNSTRHARRSGTGAGCAPQP